MGSTRKFSISFFLLVLFLPVPCQQSNSDLNLTLVTARNGTYQLVTNGTPDSRYIYNDWSCTWNLLTYDQSEEGDNSYELFLSGLGGPTQVDLSTSYSQIGVDYNVSQPCGPGYCYISLENTCSFEVMQITNFYRMDIKISGFQDTLSYYVVCDDHFQSSPWIWGLFLGVFGVAGFICVMAIYSRVWSLRGYVIAFDIRWVIAYDTLFIIMAVLRQKIHAEDFQTLLTVLSFVVGVLGVAICVNEFLFLFRCRYLSKVLFKRQAFEFRVLEVISLLIGSGALVGWLYSDHNMLVNDVVSLCISVGVIKIMKFPSLKVASVLVLVTTALELSMTFWITFIEQATYGVQIMNSQNCPFLLEIPTINNFYGLKCAWLSFSAVVFPGMLLSYFRRLDVSRSTNLYLIAGAIAFFISGVIYMFIEVSSVFLALLLPIFAVTSPCIVGLICIFAWKRQQLRMLWDGTFYDEQVVKKELSVVLQMVRSNRSSSSGRTIETRMLENLRYGNDVPNLDEQPSSETNKKKSFEKSDPS